MTYTVSSGALNSTPSIHAAERRAVAPLLLGAGASRCGSISPARGAISSKPAARHSGCRTMGQTDGPAPDRYIDPAPHTMHAVSTTLSVQDLNKIVLTFKLSDDE